MANTIKIKRSTSTAQPANSTLAAGELAYSSSSGKLFIGHPDGTTAAPQLIGYLSPTEGTLTASKPIVTDSNSKIDRINVDNLRLDGNTISSTDTNGNITITPNGTGDIVLDGQNWPQADGSANQYLKTDGSGQLSWASIPSGSFTISDNASTPNTDTFSTGDTLTFEGSTGITTTVSNDNVAIAITAGGVDTTQLADDAVTYAKLQNVSATNRILGRDSAGAGVVEEITPANLRTMINVADGATANTGALADLDTVDTTEIDDDAVTYAKIQNVSATSRVLGRITTGAGAVEELTGANIRTIANVADGATANTGALADLDTVGTSEIDNDAVTNAKLANITRGSIKVGGTSNAPTDLDAKTSGYILVGDGTDVNSVAVSGDVTLSSAGAVTIANDAVENAMIADDAVDSDQIADGAVDNVHLAGSIENSKLSNSSVTVGSTAISLGSAATTIDGLNTVHGIDGSGTDQAGTNLTIQGGGGTGTGAGGSILFQVADGGSTGSSVNSFATALTIADDGDITAAQNFTVSGNLTVSGTTTTVNSETVTFDDNILVLNNNFSGSNPTENAGFEVERGSVASNVALRWNETSDKWQVTEDGSAYKNLIHADSDVDGGTF